MIWLNCTRPGWGGQRSGLFLSHTLARVLKVVRAWLPDRLRPLVTLALPHCVEGIRCKFELLPFRCVRMDGDRVPEQLRGNWALLMTQLRQDPRVTCQYFYDLIIDDPSLLSRRLCACTVTGGYCSCMPHIRS